MKIFRNAVLSFIIICSSFVGVTAQTSSSGDQEPEKKASAIQKADDSYSAGDYSLAIEQYKKAYSKTKDRKAKAENLFRTGECYRFLNECKMAMASYKRAYKMKYGLLAQLYYADMLKCTGEYEDAIIEYQAYRQEVPDDARGEDGIESCKIALEKIDNPSRYVVNVLSSKINSKNSRDYAAAYSSKRKDDYGELYFVSSREGSSAKKESGITGQNRPDIYTSVAERKKTRGRKSTKGAGIVDLKFSEAEPLPGEFINTKVSEGAMCFDSRRKTLYFTRCIKENQQGLGCGIWMSKKAGLEWGEAEQLVIVDDSSKSVGHPSLSPDDEILYFSGDLDGSKGGMDLWMSTYDRRAKRWKNPINLGPKVNTSSNELFPFAHDDNYLYFSSNGHAGLGGLDIYRVKLNEEGMPDGEVENMGYPINTSAQDFGIIFEHDGAAKGYLSSDRGSAGDDDIYSVYLVPLKFTLDGVITSTKDNQAIGEVMVTITGTDGSTNTVTADTKGYYKFEHSVFGENTTYKLNISRKKYYTNEYDLTTIGIPMKAFEYIPSENIFLNGMKLNMEMDPIDIPIVLPNVLFDVGKWDLKPESMNSLDTVVLTLERNPNLVVEMRSHTDYTDTEERNRILSKHRADTCVSYLISKGIEAERLVPKGMGEDEPSTITEEYKNKKYYGAEEFTAGTRLTEGYIKRQSAGKQKIANQINRRTDIKVLRDDYVSGKTVKEDGTKGTIEEGKPEGEFYTVKPRESFGKIAKANKITVVELKKLNGGLRGVRPVAGMILKVTKDGDYSEFDATHIQAKTGDTFSKIAKANDVDKKELKKLNPDITDKNLSTGMYIRIK